MTPKQYEIYKNARIVLLILDLAALIFFAVRLFQNDKISIIGLILVILNLAYLIFHETKAPTPPTSTPQI
jgi:hypothetical protein